MRNAVMLAMSVLALVPFASDAGPPGYYLTGVYGDPERGYVALIQLADGRVGRARGGERFPYGTVRAVAPTWIDVEPADGGPVQRVWLRGLAPPATATPTPTAAVPAAAGAPAGPVAGGPAGSGLPTPPPATDANGPARPGGAVSRPGTRALVPAIGGAAKADSGAPAAGSPDPAVPAADDPALPTTGLLTDIAHTLEQLRLPNERDLTAADLGGVLGPLLGFPADARVVELQSRPPASFRDGLESVRRAASRNEIVRLTIEQDGQRQRVMIMPAADGNGRLILSPLETSAP